jgi:hypothetical protein
MRIRATIALLLPLVCLLGCTLPTTPPASTNSPTTPSPTPSGSWENWQIQAGAAITSPPNTYPSFLGAIQVQGAQASGIFTTVEAAGTTGQPLDYTGSFNSSTEDVFLATFGYGFDFNQPATPYTLVPVGVTGGCVYPPGYTGPECLAILAVPSVGVQIAPLNGTYTGTLTDSASASMSGTGTLTLTQASTPDSSGAFPLTGTLTFPGSSGIGTGTYPISGAVSGEGITLGYLSAAVIGPAISLTGSTNPAATQLSVSNLTWAETGPSFTFTGTLTLQ